MSELSENQKAINMLEDAISLYEKELVDEKQNKILGTTKADKLKQKYKDFPGLYEQIKPYIKHLEGLSTLPRCAGFGGWPCEVSNTMKWITFNHKTQAEQEKVFEKLPKELPKDKKSDYNVKSFKDFKDACKKGIKNFIKWYFDQDLHCYYCGVSEEDCRLLIPEQGARGGTRAQHLEIERKNAKKGENIYNNSNCVLACYVCNNTKSNFISQVEFAPFAKDINEWWNKKREEWNQKHPDKLIKEIVFPEGHWKGLENQSNN